MADFDHKTIEAKWREKWRADKTYELDLAKAKKPFYNLMMFPYPSAEGLHVGNMYAFTGADVYGRYQRMKGYDVLEPIGLDGFGIHSENFAIKIGKHPAEQAKISQAHFYDQLSKIGNGFAWDQRLETYDPAYYKWTQWLFIQMFKHGLAYRKKARVNWCPSCKTVLADEQVIDGRCERCKTETTYKELEQWFFKITEYAEKLLAGIEEIKWPEKIKTAQRQWIGKKTGINITYQVQDTQDTLTCFTTTPVNFGATFIVVAPEHPFIEKIISGQIEVTPEQKLAVTTYVQTALRKSEQLRIAEGKEKTGVFTGRYAVNHVNGQAIPIWVTDFVLINVGTGAVQGCPGHDTRDFDFAKKFGIPITRVVVGPDGDLSEIDKPEKVIEKGMKGKMVNSDFLNGMDFAEAMQKTMDYFEEQGWGKRVDTYHLRDWLISRQRYWGPPIPMVYCESEKEWQPVPQDQLPVTLPDIKDFQPKGDGSAPLDNAPDDWLYTKCPQCGGRARRETNVSDTFLDSAWYFLAYPNIHTEEYRSGTLPWNNEIIKQWLPVSAYIGGAEHAVLHLLYSRFVWKALVDWEYLPFTDKPEPFPFLYGHGLIIKDGAKMSKSRGNIVNPDEYMEKYGADALRMYLMFIGPYDQGGDFNDAGMVGMKRFLNRVWGMFEECRGRGPGETPKELKSKLQETITKVDRDYSNFRFNTAIAAMMEFFNAWRDSDETRQQLSRSDAKTVVKLLAPLAPYVSEELWEMLQGEGSVHHQDFPQVDVTALTEKPALIVVQVDGKLRQTLSREWAEVNEQSMTALAQADPQVAKWLEGKRVDKVIWVPPSTKRQGLLNFVVS